MSDSKESLKIVDLNEYMNYCDVLEYRYDVKEYPCLFLNGKLTIAS
jgi:hypothetical protein